jgi:predicted nuclease of restriction endonuclease-like (RecB) superfamily
VIEREPAVPEIVASDSILQRVVAKLPWAHHVTLLDRVKDRSERFWYMQQAVEHGWSRSVLTVQIKAKAHRGAGKAITNFAATLPPVQSDLAQQTLKDPYVFDFLALGLAARERELEQGLIDHIQKFLVTLGVGFAFVGRQVHLEIGGQDYYLDLLFYHLKLRCFVVIDLKVEAFKPEFAGKMNFYLSAVDAQMRHQDDQPTIGLLLCQENNRITVEYALRDVKKPIGVAQWKTKLVDSLPKNLRGALPTIAEIERELAKG